MRDGKQDCRNLSCRQVNNNRVSGIGQLLEEIDGLFRCGDDLDLGVSEWANRVRIVFSWLKPFEIKLDTQMSLRAVVRAILDQADLRQKVAPNYTYAVVKNLVGAKLDCALGKGHFRYNSFSTADEPNDRSGNFFVGDVAIHVTTAPGEAVIERCRENLNDGHRPILVTIQRGLSVAEGLAANAELADRIDLFEIEQFVALNLYEIGKFAADGRKVAIRDLVARYNEIIEEFETDPSLKIELRR